MIIKIPTNGEIIANLEAIKATLAQGWCQNANAKDSDGQRVSACASSAVCWCLSGAHMLHGDDLVVWRALKRVHSNPVRFNDEPGRTQGDMIAFVDKAIELVRAQECEDK